MCDETHHRTAHVVLLSSAAYILGYHLAQSGSPSTERVSKGYEEVFLDEMPLGWWASNLCIQRYHRKHADTNPDPNPRERVRTLTNYYGAKISKAWPLTYSGVLQQIC